MGVLATGSNGEGGCGKAGGASHAKAAGDIGCGAPSAAFLRSASCIQACVMRWRERAKMMVMDAGTACEARVSPPALLLTGGARARVSSRAHCLFAADKMAQTWGEFFSSLNNMAATGGGVHPDGTAPKPPTDKTPTIPAAAEKKAEAAPTQTWKEYLGSWNNMAATGGGVPQEVA